MAVFFVLSYCGIGVGSFDLLRIARGFIYLHVQTKLREKRETWELDDAES